MRSPAFRVRPRQLMNVPRAKRIVIFLLFILQSCSSVSKHQSSRTDSTTATSGPSPEELITVSPNHCRIVGTVVNIDTLLEPANAGTPCSVAPCKGTVRVDSVIAYGQSFPMPLSKGESISVKFIYTTGPTEKIFPKMKPSFPGLHAGSAFVADVSGNQGPMLDKIRGVVFEIGPYEVR